MRQPENIVRVVQKLRLFHRRGPQLKAEFNGFRNVEMLTAVARDKACTFPFDFELIMTQVRAAARALLGDPYTPTPCHNDLLNLNWLNEELPGGGAEVRLLDWEYAGMGDVYFDLANFCHHHELSDDQARLLCRERGILRLRLAHGRGRGVQRAAVRRTLASIPEVVSFEDAPPASGGWGATVVVLRADTTSSVL